MVCIFLHAHAALFSLKNVFLLNYDYYLTLKNEHIQTEIIQFSENTFKIKTVLDKSLFLVLITFSAEI